KEEFILMIRRASKEDANALSELSFRSKAYWGYNDAFMKACREDLKVTEEDINLSHVYVLEVYGKVVAFYSLVYDKEGAELRNFFVDPIGIGKGYGKYIWKHLIETAKCLGIEQFFIHSDPHAEGFYKKMGAMRIGEVQSTVFPDRKLPFMQAMVKP
ncbi:GNAT family N-acetyltransferase, partial [Aneurinibacillus aneurinilyticus]